MALRDHLPRWLRSRLRPGSHAQHMHDALAATFDEVAVDLAQSGADTVIAEAGERGMGRWELDLSEPRRAGQTLAQRRATAQAIKQGKMADDAAIRFALDKWGISYDLYEFGDGATFWDQGFYDQAAISVPPLQIQIDFRDPFGGATPTAEQKAEKQRALNNAVADVNRIKARGVRVVATVPPSLR